METLIVVAAVSLVVSRVTLDELRTFVVKEAVAAGEDIGEPEIEPDEDELVIVPQARLGGDQAPRRVAALVCAGGIGVGVAGSG